MPHVDFTKSPHTLASSSLWQRGSSKSSKPQRRKWCTWRGREEGRQSHCPVTQHTVITLAAFYLWGPVINDTFSYLLFLRSSLRTSAPRQRGVTGTWSTSAVSSARQCWGDNAISWRRDGLTAAPALSRSMRSTATPAGNILVRKSHLGCMFFKVGHVEVTSILQKVTQKR